MKIRYGFVSNSSTTSFTCCICGEKIVEYDSVSLVDIDMCRCEKDHMMCLECAGEKVKEHIHSHNECRYGDEIIKDICPICTMKEFSLYDIEKYLFNLYKIPRDEAFANVKSMNRRRRVLHLGEYIGYVGRKMNIQVDDMYNEIRTKYGTYEEFKKNI